MQEPSHPSTRPGVGQGRGAANEPASESYGEPRRALPLENAREFWRLRDPARFSGSESGHNIDGARSSDEQDEASELFSHAETSQPHGAARGFEAREDERRRRRRQRGRGRDRSRSRSPRAARARARARGGQSVDEAEAYFFVPADECPICWEQQNFLMRDTRPRGGASADVQQSQGAMVQKITDYRKVIFDLEVSLRTVQNDAIVWKAMLLARREYIERYLIEYGVPFTAWTREILETHYDVRNGHTFDLERDYRMEERDMRKIQTKIVKNALYMKTPPGDVQSHSGGGGGGEDDGNLAINLRSAEMIIKLSKRRQELNKAIEECVKGRAEDTQAASRQIISLLQNTAAQRQADGAFDAPGRQADGVFDENAEDACERPSDVIADMYNVGGL